MDDKPPSSTTENAHDESPTPTLTFIFNDNRWYHWHRATRAARKVRVKIGDGVRVGTKALAAPPSSMEEQCWSAWIKQPYAGAQVSCPEISHTNF
uniref:Uncharacterized protein n=1 Tax=Oryza brachyantha TaxID=4533 RepID=J3LCX3_ORYBR